MNEPAVRLEEQIISLFSNLETELYQGWVLKQTSRKAVVYPLYGASLCRQDIEHIKYYLASLLEDNGYKRHCHIIAEQYVNEWFDTPDHNESTAGRKEKWF